jgi:hypothetical protein
MSIVVVRHVAFHVALYVGAYAGPEDACGRFRCCEVGRGRVLANRPLAGVIGFCLSMSR